tara:strand:+ start:2285 stop:3151 length:867 start_codon:yes stop_codon:yes gene_type:complete
MKKTLGIIGGSGLYDLKNSKIIQSHKIDTPWGKPSDDIVECSLHDLNIFFLPRHDKNHSIAPSQINYRANIDALKQCGVTDILSISAVGSLNDNLKPGTFVIIDQYIDHTKVRKSTFFDNGIVAHVSMAEPTDIFLMNSIRDTLADLDIKYNFGGTYICIEGPQFSSFSESKLFKKWGCDVIGMTNMPEAKLCREADIRYVSIGMVTDYDCWHPEYSNVEVSNVIENLNNNIKNAQLMVVEFSKNFSKLIIESNLNVYKSIVTPINKIDKDTKDKLRNIVPKLRIDTL